MARTDATNVKKIIDVDDGDDLTPHISTANELVTEMATGDNAPSPAYSSNRLELIERWLAAHAYALFRERAFMQDGQQNRQQFQRKIDFNLHATLYGQMAMTLDTQGKLAELSKKIQQGRKTLFFWGGKLDQDEWQEDKPADL